MSIIDAPDSTMSLRNRNASSTGFFIAYAILALVVVPFLLVKQEADTFNNTLPFLMAGGPALAGLWGAISTYLPDPKTGKTVPGRNAKAAVMLLLMAVVSIGTWFATNIVVGIGGDDWNSYDILKSGGLATYVVLGLLPAIAYCMLLHSMSSRRIMSAKWLILSMICLATSMLAPWFWAGFKLYADNHVM